MGRVTNDPDLDFWFEDEEEDMGFNYYMDEAAQTAIYKQEYQRTHDFTFKLYTTERTTHAIEFAKMEKIRKAIYIRSLEKI